MKKIIAILVILHLVGCSTPDPITTLSQRLNESGGLWVNGLFPNIDLPPTATLTEVLNEAIIYSGFDEGHIKKYKIITVRQVTLNDGMNSEYTAAFIDSDLGQKIFLMRYMGKTWWTRFFNPKQWTEQGVAPYVAQGAPSGER